MAVNQSFCDRVGIHFFASAVALASQVPKLTCFWTSRGNQVGDLTSFGKSAQPVEYCAFSDVSRSFRLSSGHKSTYPLFLLSRGKKGEAFISAVDLTKAATYLFLLFRGKKDSSDFDFWATRGKREEAKED